MFSLLIYSLICSWKGHNYKKVDEHSAYFCRSKTKDITDYQCTRCNSKFRKITKYE